MHHFVKRALTFALAAGLLSSPAAALASPTPAAKTTFTIGIQSDVDSTNPFTGIVVEAYETYALMYDYLTTSSPKDVSPQPSSPSPTARLRTRSPGRTRSDPG